MFKQNVPADDASNEDYIGNMWGWKFSFISLFFILIFVGWLVYSHHYRVIPESMEKDPVETSVNEDL